MLFNWNSDNLIRKVNIGAERGAKIAAVMLEAAIKQDISLPGPVTTKQFARLTKKTKRDVMSGKVELRASRPGEPPRKRTGTLRSSVQHEKIKEGREVIAYRVGYVRAIKYGVYLEFGTRKMAPRPAVRAAYLRELPNIAKVMVREVARELST